MDHVPAVLLSKKQTATPSCWPLCLALCLAPDAAAACAYLFVAQWTLRSACSSTLSKFRGKILARPPSSWRIRTNTAWATHEYLYGRNPRMLGALNDPHPSRVQWTYALTPGVFFKRLSLAMETPRPE